MSRFINPIPQFILSNGDVAAGGTLTFYEVDTDTPITLYADEDQTVTISNPVTLGDRGEVPNIFFSVAARVVFKDSAGTQVFDVQPAALAGGSGGSGGVGGWVSNATYSQLSIVFGSDGEFYISLVNENTGNDPADSPDDSPNWTRLKFLKFWNSQDTFGPGALVVAGSSIYVSQISDNTGFNPETDTSGNWKNLTDASLVPYDNTASGLSAITGQAAIDQLRNLIDAIIQPLTYMGVLDVSAGDGALPGAPANGDLYVIGVGGTITVSEDGAAPASTAVTQGDVIAWNDGESRWDLLPSTTSAASVLYDNTTSGLAALNVQTAIDEVEGRVDTNEADISQLRTDVDGLGDGVTYKGSLDVSAGDSALPSGPVAGDLYGISVGGTITVSVNGAAPTATAVTAGQQIVYNDITPSWDLQASVTSAGEISYDNTSSGFDSVTVQGAIDEVNYLDDFNTTGTFERQARLNDLTVTTTSAVTITLDDSTFGDRDLVRIRKTRETGLLTIETTNNQTLPDGTTDTSNFFPDGTTGTVELRYNGATWNVRIY